jgi:deferrochelatase/peroxidase EfeB
MSSSLQEGIYYRSKPLIGDSFCIVTLKAINTSDIGDIGRSIKEIWKRLDHLKKGITVDLNIDLRHRKIGNLTILLAYGLKLFALPGSKKSAPLSLSGSRNFKTPYPAGGGPIVEGLELCYSPHIFENHMLEDHLAFQFIADTEFYTKRASVEVWKALRKLEKDVGRSCLQITGFYAGFQRADRRNWFGFHDGVSNNKTRERPHVISVDSRSVNARDKWTTNGTYLAFMRIALDLERWENTPVTLQEITIGRNKLTGCPLIGVDKNRKPIKDSRCPVPGTSEVIDPGNEYFRDHPPYGIRTDDKILQLSHIGSTSPAVRIPTINKKSMRIFRQGFEFLAASKDPPGFVAGLNFVSFQNSPQNLFDSLGYRSLIAKKIPEFASTVGLEQYMSVLAAGIFFVPPLIQNEPFPGANIFYDVSEMKNLMYRHE